MKTRLELKQSDGEVTRNDEQEPGDERGAENTTAQRREKAQDENARHHGIGCGS